MAFLKSVIYQLILGIAAHYIGEALPRRWFHWDRFPFRSHKWEKNGALYEKLRIQDWKDHMPDMSRVMKDMVPKRVGLCPSSEEVWSLVRETCVAETVHLALCLLAPGIWLFWYDGVGVFLSCVALVGNLPFVMIQRYNRPILVSLAQRLELREARKRKLQEAKKAEEAQNTEELVKQD